MNTMMREFALEAGGSHYPNVNTMQLERFYELVVRECARVVDQKIGPTSALDVLEHFGVNDERNHQRTGPSGGVDKIDQ